MIKMLVKMFVEALQMCVIKTVDLMIHFHSSFINNTT